MEHPRVLTRPELATELDVPKYMLADWLRLGLTGLIFRPLTEKETELIQKWHALRPRLCTCRCFRILVRSNDCTAYCEKT